MLRYLGQFGLYIVIELRIELQSPRASRRLKRCNHRLNETGMIRCILIFMQAA